LSEYFCVEQYTTHSHLRSDVSALNNPRREYLYWHYKHY